jgi:feruloyl-CoA synthase
VVGLPAAGVELKLVPVEDKMEARVRGPNIMPGYWRAPAATRDAFDEEGFYKFGDALRFVDPARPDLGFAFDGRITEDFKLSTGTWVSVGPLRARLVQRGAPWVRDAVIAGINQDYVAVLIVPDAACAALPAAELHATLRRLLRDLAAESTGSSNRVVRALVLHDRLDIDAGEVTDKGSLNQRAVLRHRADKVAALYADPKSPDVISIENDAG